MSIHFRNGPDLLWTVVAARQRAQKPRGAAPGAGGPAVGMGKSFELPNQPPISPFVP